MSAELRRELRRIVENAPDRDGYPSEKPMFAVSYTFKNGGGGGTYLANADTDRLARRLVLSEYEPGEVAVSSITPFDTWLRQMDYGSFQDFLDDHGDFKAPAPGSVVQLGAKA